MATDWDNPVEARETVIEVVTRTAARMAEAASPRLVEAIINRIQVTYLDRDMFSVDWHQAHEDLRPHLVREGLED